MAVAPKSKQIHMVALIRTVEGDRNASFPLSPNTSSPGLKITSHPISTRF